MKIFQTGSILSSFVPYLTGLQEVPRLTGSRVVGTPNGSSGTLYYEYPYNVFNNVRKIYHIFSSYYTQFVYYQSVASPWFRPKYMSLLTIQRRN